jgi:hypothetical protein
MSHFVNLINMMNHFANNNNILNRSFNDQGGCTKPCSASFIDSLEKVVVTNEDVDKGLCCAICQEEFKMGEHVVRLPCKDPHYFHCDTPDDVCGGILPWLKDHNSCPVCREEFPEEESDDIPVPDENFDVVDDPQVDNNNNNNDDEVDDQVNQQIENIIQRLFTLPPINPLPLPNQPINLRNTIYIPMIIPMNNYSEGEDPDLQEAIRQSLGS